MLHIIPKISVILVAIGLFILLPFTRPVFKTIQKVSYIRCSIIPRISTESMRLSILVVPRIRVTVLEVVGALSMLQAIDELAFKAVPVLPLVDTVAIDLTLVPLSDI